MGPDSWCARLYAAIVFLPRSFYRAKKSRRPSSFWSFGAGHSLSARGSGSFALPLPNPIGRASSIDAIDSLTDLRDQRVDTAESSDAVDQRWEDRTRLLSGLSAGPKCE